MTALLSKLKPLLQIDNSIKALIVISVLVASLIVVDWLFRSDTFPVETVSFEGEFNHVTRGQLEQAIRPYLTDNYLVLNLEQIKVDIEKLPWVFRASIRRSWPSGLHISYLEQDLVARWLPNAWLNRFGEEVRLSNSYTDESQLPSLAGPAGTGKQVLHTFHMFRDILARAGLSLTTLRLTQRRSWELVAGSVKNDNGFQIVMGKENEAQSLRRFSDVYSQQFAAKNISPVRFDLRYTNGFSVNWGKILVSKDWKALNGRITEKG
ncbi:MAG: cell division protein FtsQ/DivIB [Gammaproteobacteria bacterium]|nr:MAG: cell division protein FtsQ/DivIB [Gammaproteobacteria bacterium]